MGLNFAYLEYLAERGHLQRGSRVLDIGSQNLLHAKPEQLSAFAKRFGYVGDEAALQKEAERIALRSVPCPPHRTSYVSEILDFTDIFYTSFDVAPALKTEIIDLNSEDIPEHYRGSFDIVLNFGTSEHIFNQFNVFKVMHDAMKVGGVCFHQVPYAGWPEHGYVVYHKRFFDDLAAANGYEVLDMWLCPAYKDPAPTQLDMRGLRTPLVPNSADAAFPPIVLNGLICALFRKTRPAPFRVDLEAATAHAPVSAAVQERYARLP